MEPAPVDATRRRPAHVAAAAAAAVQYALAYGVGLPVFAMYRAGRRLRRRSEPELPPRTP